MNILVTGANGQLGQEMQIASHGLADCFLFTDIADGYTRLDITDLDAVRQFVAQNSIECIVNCAAWTNVDAAETAFDAAEALNAAAPENLALAMKEAGGLLVHISTDYVFGAEPYNTPCREDQTGTPTGVYGLTKLHGEQRILATGCKHVIIRTAWLYSEFGKNFLKTMLALTASKPRLSVVSDQVGTPTYALDLANAILAVVADYSSELSKNSEHSEYSKTGIYHYSNEGVCSWYDFAHAIARLSGHTACHVAPCRSSEFPSPVKRPAYSVLDKTKIKAAFGLAIPHWTESLERCMEKLKESTRQ